eukprot:TRINITY_DN49540_c0_g1_i1.p1 TRINITY_DN49540_c0_g1~~TRINITY_DN49540_c0_g1_i1.p1  ORF type:complete len:261 (+),score=17.15 TRINITY_DN49540_c0_g1_i1:374-1156(+)
MTLTSPLSALSQRPVIHEPVIIRSGLDPEAVASMVLHARTAMRGTHHKPVTPPEIQHDSDSPVPSPRATPPTASLRPQKSPYPLDTQPHIQPRMMQTPPRKPETTVDTPEDLATIEDEFRSGPSPIEQIRNPAAPESRESPRVPSTQDLIQPVLKAIGVLDQRCNQLEGQVSAALDHIQARVSVMECSFTLLDTPRKNALATQDPSEQPKASEQQSKADPATPDLTPDLSLTLTPDQPVVMDSVATVSYTHLTLPTKRIV